MDRDTARPTVDAMPGPNAAAWVDHYEAHAAPSEHAHEFVWDLTAEAEGPFVTDVDGNVLLDFTCHIGAAPLGYNNPKLRAKFDGIPGLDPLKIAGQDFYYGAGATPGETEFPGSADLMERLADVSAHYDMDTVFLSNSGAEAMENAMKVAYDACPQPKYGVTFEDAFHGRTLGTLSLTRSGSVYTRKFPEVSGIRTLPFCADRGCSPDTCDCGFFTDAASRLREMLGPGGHIDPAEVAFLALEPVQGVGGYNFPSEAFMREVGEVCADHDIAVIVDEIQTGVGRTGEMWAVDHYPLEPDVITSAKALRVGATVARSELFPDEKNRLGSTWGGGDVVSSMYGAFTLDVIREHGLLDNATARGRQFRERLADDAPDVVRDVRGTGLLLALTFDSRERRDAVVRAGMKRGLLTLGCGERSLRVLPPLDVTEREIELGATLLLEAVEASSPLPASS